MILWECMLSYKIKKNFVKITYNLTTIIKIEQY